MKAIVKNNPGKGADLVEYPIPLLQGDQVLIRVKAASICGTDLHIYNWNDWAINAGIKMPIVLGHECCGEVVEVGPSVKTLKAGDYVACETHIPCGRCYQCNNGLQHICSDLKLYGIHMNGCFAEYSKISERCAIKISDKINPKIGAVLEPLGTAIRACIEIEASGKNVAVIGCGPIGLMAVNALKAFGTANIIAVDVNELRLNIAKKVGATHIVNPVEVDPAKYIIEITKGIGVDAFIDASGNNRAIVSGFESLRKGGMAALIGLPSKPLEIELVSKVIFKEARIVGIHGRKMNESWTTMLNLLDMDLLNIDPIITHVLRLEDFEKGFEILSNGTGGKVILVP